MFDFIERHQRMFLVIMGAVILIMVIVLFLVNRGVSQPPTTNQNANAENSLNYDYLKKYTDKEDQNILLTAHIAAEEYGTYSKSDFNSLNDLFSQSTSNFKPTVQELIDGAPNSTGVSTIAKPDTFNLNKQGSTNAVVTMDAVRTEPEKPDASLKITVTLIKQNSFWLIDNITTSNE
jgi:hypothetical protein